MLDIPFCRQTLQTVYDWAGKPFKRYHVIFEIPKKFRHFGFNKLSEHRSYFDLFTLCYTLLSFRLHTFFVWYGAHYIQYFFVIVLAFQVFVSDDVNMYAKILLRIWDICHLKSTQQTPD